MEMFNKEEFENYIRANYKLLYTSKEIEYSGEIPGRCDKCNRDAFIKIHSESFIRRIDFDLPTFASFYNECPKCRRKSFLFLAILERSELNEENLIIIYEFYTLFRLPSRDEDYESKDIL